jgi:hypothetical protein
LKFIASASNNAKPIVGSRFVLLIVLYGGSFSQKNELLFTHVICRTEAGNYFISNLVVTKTVVCRPQVLTGQMNNFAIQKMSYIKEQACKN